MAALQLTSAVLDELVAAFSAFSGKLASACADIRNGDANLTGDDPLSGQVHSFAGSWNYGITQLGQHSHECITMLHEVGTTFEQLDCRLASELPSGDKR